MEFCNRCGVRKIGKPGLCQHCVEFLKPKGDWRFRIDRDDSVVIRNQPKPTPAAMHARILVKDGVPCS